MAITVGPEGTKYIKLEIAIWFNEADKSIHITAPQDDNKFHSTVNNNPTSKRCHESLYKHFKRMLQSSGKWPKN